MAVNRFGMPTEVDVRILRDKFQVPVIGTIIQYAEIEATINHSKNDGRFKSVVTAWRNRLRREHDVLMVAIPNVGYQAADPKRRISYSVSKNASGLRSIRKAATVAITTDESTLDEGEKLAKRRIAMTGGLLRLAEATQPKQLELKS